MKAFRKLVNKLYIIRRQMKHKPKIKFGYKSDDPFDPKKHGQEFLSQTKKD